MTLTGFVERNTRAGLCAAFVLLPGAAFAQMPPALMPPPATISVTGEGKVIITPDIAEVDGGVATDAKTAREATELNNKTMAEVIQALKSTGISEKDISTTRLSLSPQYPPNRTLPAQVVGYRAVNHVRVRLREVGKAPIILDTMISAGANEVGGIGFMVSEPSKPLDQARAEAMADAKRKAEIYAKAAGVALGAPLQISEDNAALPASPIRDMALRATAASTPVEPGEQTLRVNVSVTFQIKAP